MGQQLSTYNLRLYRPSIDNPAAMFMNKSKLSVFMVHNKQWVGYEGAPVSTNLSFDKKLGKLAIGGVLNSDKASMFNTTHLNLNSAYQFQVSHNSYIAFGLGIGLVNQAFDFSGVDVVNGSDALLGLNGEQRFGVDGNIGAYYMHDKFHIGISVPHVFQRSINYEVLDDSYSFLFNRQLTANAGVYLDSLVSNVVFEPYTQFRMIPGVIYQYDVGLNSKINNKVVVNVGYRSFNSLLFGVGVSLNNKINLYYSANLGSNDLYSRSQGSHEVAMSFRIEGEKTGEEIFEDNLLVVAELDSLEEVVDSMDLKLQQICTCKDIDVYVKYLNERIDSLKGDEREPYIAKLDSIEDFIVNDDGETVPNGKVENPYDMDAEKIGVGHTFVVNDVYFETGSYILDHNSLAILDLFVEFLRANPNITIEIGGHTDDIGTDLNNYILSQNRARAVYMYFLVNGIDGFRMQYAGFGESRPVMPNINAKNRAMNRRTEIMITGM